MLRSWSLLYQTDNVDWGGYEIKDESVDYWNRETYDKDVD